MKYIGGITHMSKYHSAGIWNMDLKYVAFCVQKHIAAGVVLS